VTTFAHSIDPLLPLLELCRTSEQSPSNIKALIDGLDRLRRFILLVEEEVETQMRTLGYGTLITPAERARVDEIKRSLNT
jgi:hypothetical protein